MGRRTSFPEIPVFENFFLKSIADALAKRRKALSHGCDNIELTCSTDLKGKLPFERLDLTLWFGRSASDRICFTAWEDSLAWVWVGEHKKKAGWIFEAKLHANLRDFEPRDIVRRVEATRCVQDQAALEKLWNSPEQRKNKRR